MKEKKLRKDEFVSSLSSNIKKLFVDMDVLIFDEIEEIRLRIDREILIKHRGKNYFIDSNSKFSDKNINCVKASKDDVLESLELMSEYSLYAFEEEMRNAFITISGGHRIGIAGKVVIDDDKIKTIKNISSLNIRMSHQIIGSADNLLKKLVLDGRFLNTLIISAPACGKTTLLRDLIRQASNGVDGVLEGKNISVVDERSEIAASYMSRAQNDLGIRTDILDSCPKSLGIILVLRSMSADIIAVDEIASKEDVQAIENAINSGVAMLCTIHAKDLEELKNKNNTIIENQFFERFVVLSNKNKVGTIEGVYNKYLELI